MGGTHYFLVSFDTDDECILEDIQTKLSKKSDIFNKFKNWAPEWVNIIKVTEKLYILGVYECSDYTVEVFLSKISELLDIKGIDILYDEMEFHPSNRFTDSDRVNTNINIDDDDN
jgi:hypothetical protein